MGRSPIEIAQARKHLRLGMGDAIRDLSRVTGTGRLLPLDSAFYVISG
jgi:hypothetical protein